jgi:FKBP-type peptidyl-prolyl cis-trans isomerase FkpA
MRRLIPILALLAVSACSNNNNSTAPTVPPTTTAPYSQTDLVIGFGATAAATSTVTVAYTGWLHDASKPDAKGSVFDSGTITTRLGAGQVIRGWDQGIPGMRVGGQRRLVIPPELAYGNSTPNPAKIPTNATLIFDVTLNAVQ